MSFNQEKVLKSEVGKFIFSLALRYSIIENQLIKNGNSEELLEFYNSLKNPHNELEEVANIYETKIIKSEK